MKTAIVTGGTRGIGKGIVLKLLKEGYFVYLSYSQDDSIIENLKIELNKISPFFSIHKVNQACYGELSSFIKEIKNKTKTVECIVCNAGTTIRKKFSEITNDEWEFTMNVNLNSNFYLIRDLMNNISNNSRIIFIGSMLAIQPHATSIAYGVSKAALHALAKNLVKEFEETGTTVNVIAPGFVETEWQKEKPQEIRKNIYSKTAIKRFATVEEISDAVLFCINNAYINGSILEINGGYSYK